MIRDITIGQYYQTKSVIHELDPRVKLMGTLVFIISLFLGKSVWMYLAVTAFLAAIIKLSNVPLKFIVKGLKAVLILIIFSAAFNLFLTDGEVVVRLWKLKITKEGIYQAGIYGYKTYVPYYGLITYDTYDNAEQSYRWT